MTTQKGMIQMTGLNQINSQEELSDFKKVLYKVRECDIVVTLKRFIPRPDGKLNNMILQQSTCKIKSLININEEFIYLTLISSNKAELKKIKSMWETVLRRGTQTALESKQNDYALVIDLIKQELQYNTVYTLSFTQPVFVSREDDNRSTGLAEFMLVFKADHVYFGIENLTLDEIEYGMSLNREREIGNYNSDIDSDSDDNTKAENEDFISNEKFLNVSDPTTSS